MELNKVYKIELTGKCVKKEIYKDGKIRAWIQDDTSQEMAIVLDKDVEAVS